MLQRLWNLLKGFFGLGIKRVETANPEVLVELEAENLRKQVAQYNQGLIAHASLCERLIAQVKRLENEQGELTSKVSASLKTGNRQAGGQYALRLQTVERELTDNRKQSEQAEITYRELVRGRDVAVAAAKAKIETLQANIGDMKMQQAVAELQEMAAGLVSNIGGAGDTLNRLQLMVEQERERAAGRARVARDNFDTRYTGIKEEEQAALADDALTAFENRR